MKEWNPTKRIVIANEVKQSGFFDEIAAHLSGARNDGLGRGLVFKWDLGCNKLLILW
jgi:hypothetical protein